MFNNERFSKLVGLVQENTPLNKKESVCYLLETEDVIRCNQIYKNNSCIDKDYFLLATAKLIDQYKSL